MVTGLQLKCVSDVAGIYAAWLFGRLC